MQKVFELAKSMSVDLEKDWTASLENLNLHKIFYSLSDLPDIDLKTINIITCYIIFAYDNDSTWLNLKQDRLQNKNRILSSITDTKTPYLEEMIYNDSADINDVIASYLEEQATWKFRAVMSLLDFNSRMMRFVNQKTEEEKTYDKLNKEGEIKQMTKEYDIDVITRVNKQKGELLEQAIGARERADKLISELKKEFVQVDHATQGDFGFEITDEKKINPELWRDFIKFRVIPLREKQKLEK